MRLHKCAALLAGVAAAALAVPAIAQTAQPSSADAPQAGSEAPGAGDIIVTAQRRDESLSRTPVAVSVISSETLARANITTENDLPVATPGLQVRLGQNSNQLNYALRGQSLDAYSNTRPGVQPYINEVQIGGVGASSGFFDLQSVQVLKGPQGTLFGRNSTGGAVLFTTQKPTKDFGGYVSATGGNYGLVKVEGAINAPLIGENLLARVSAFYQRRDGYQYNLNTKSDTGGYERFGIRGSLTAKLGDNISNTLVVDYQSTDGSNAVATVGSIDASL
jgi:iron complex outermembrane recepter protein